jgi:hypothetical protein
MTRTVEMLTAPDGCTDPARGQLLAAYEWGLLTPGEDHGFEEHLVSCEACATELLATSRTTAALRSTRPRRTRVWLPLGAAAAAAAVLLFSNLLSQPRDDQTASLVSTDTVAAPVQQAAMTFELNVPSQSQFSYELAVPGNG